MKNLNYFLSALFILLFISSCVDREFDLPPVPEPADLETNASISDLKALYVPGAITEITEDYTIDILVAANDRSGNYFRAIIVQDETGGVQIQINATGLHTDYPVGSKLFLKTKGLVIGANNGNIQIGGYAGTGGSGSPQVFGIEPVLLNEHLIKGVINGGLEPKVTTISELGKTDESTLITLENVQFVDNALGQTLADIEGGFSRNLGLEDCEGNRLIVRTSNFATFGGEQVPCGNGTITAIYSVFGSDRQLFIRELEDVQFTESRCDGTDPCAGGSGEQINISEIRAMYTGTTTSVPAGRYIQGIVISDRAGANVQNRNIVIQQPGDKGITVRFVDPHTFDLNDQVTIDVSGMELSEFNGLLQINQVPLFRAAATGTGTIVPNTLTISQILADFENLESTLIKINDATISGSSTYAFTTTVTDNTGSIDMFTTNFATFSNSPVPASAVNITALVSQGGNESARQISMRNLNDVDGEGGGGESEKISIAELRGLFTGSTTTAPANRFIEGVVISDRANENITERNLVIQEPGGKGIVIRFNNTNTFDLNTIIRVDIGGMELSEFNGLLQLNNVPNANAVATGTGTITPVVLTIAGILNDFENLESTLVRIQNVTISKPSGTTFALTTIMNDGTGTLDLFTTNYSSFADQNFPTGTVTVTGYVNQGGAQASRQLSIRNPGLDIN